MGSSGMNVLALFLLHVRKTKLKKQPRGTTIHMCMCMCVCTGGTNKCTIVVIIKVYRYMHTTRS
jgi:hypothetical protein